MTERLVGNDIAAAFRVAMRAGMSASDLAETYSAFMPNHARALVNKGSHSALKQALIEILDIIERPGGVGERRACVDAVYRSIAVNLSPPSVRSVPGAKTGG